MIPWNRHGIDWTETRTDDKDMRRCANPEWIGCLMPLASFIGGFVLGCVAWLWVSACP